MLDQALLCLATTIYMESAHEPKEAQIAVGYVLLRRAEFEHKNICYQMKRPAQFSWYGIVKPPSVIRQEYKNIAYRVLHRLEGFLILSCAFLMPTSIACCTKSLAISMSSLIV